MSITFYWEEIEEDLSLNDKIESLISNDWKIVSVCVTEFRTNGIKNIATKAIIVCTM